MDLSGTGGPGFGEFGKLLLLAGLLLAGLGAVLWLGGQAFNLGRLPGDIYIKKGPVSFYFPLMTGLLLSVILTILLNLFLRRQ